MAKTTVLGAGSWGTALSLVLADAGHEVTLWGRNTEVLQKIQASRENSKYLPGVQLPDAVCVEEEMARAVAGAELVVLSVPSHGVRETARTLAKCLTTTPVLVNTAKGIELATLARLSQVILEEIPACGEKIAVLSGPSHAEEVGRRQPTAIVSATESKKVADFVQDCFMTPSFRVYTNPDILGVEMAGALKNVIALATGICDGLGFGDNTKAALLTRGLTEIARLGSKMGAEVLTFAGLSGIGDLVVTCTSMHSRNRRAGIQLGKGIPLPQVLKDMGMVVEGIKATEAAYRLAQKYEVDVPITHELYKILFEGLDPKQGVSNLMGRSKTHEVEDIVLNRRDW